MSKQNPIRQGLAVAVILLFIGVTFAPSINAIEDPAPDLDCYGDLYYIGSDLEPGMVITGSFTVENIGESGSELDWEIESFPDWGDWIADPERMFDLTPEDGPVTVDVACILPENIDDIEWGEITIINLEDENDFCIITISIQRGINNDLVEQLKTVDLKDFKEINKLDGIKHPSLYYIVYFIAAFRNERANILFNISCHIDNWGSMNIYYPLIFLRMIWLDNTVLKWCNFWNYISDTLGWGWNLPFHYPYYQNK